MTNFAQLGIIDRLPSAFRPEDGDPIPEFLVGSRIMRIGTLTRDDAVQSEPSIEGGGLVIDFIPDGSDQLRRVVFSFNELGMWQVYPGT